jgi:DnaJ family protein B protein 4
MFGRGGMGGMGGMGGSHFHFHGDDDFDDGFGGGGFGGFPGMGGRARQRKAKPIKRVFQCSLEELYTGTTKKLKVTKQVSVSHQPQHKKNYLIRKQTLIIILMHVLPFLN